MHGEDHVHVRSLDGCEERSGYTLISCPMDDGGANPPSSSIDINATTEDTSPMTAKVTLEDVKRVAELAHLELTPEETRNMEHDLNAILDHVAQLNELDTSSVAPLAQMSELGGTAGEGSLREDAVRPSLDRAAVMSEAPETDQVFFKVPKVIER